MDFKPNTAWQTVAGWIGLPVELRSPKLRTLPWLTWGLAILIVVLNLFVWNNQKVIDKFGFLPQEPLRIGGVTFLSSFLLHAGILHLVGNLYFFLIFGDNVEDYLGKKKFLLLLLGSHFLGVILHTTIDPRPDIPLVGASAGIFGVMVFYALQFPEARMGGFISFIRWYPVMRWYYLPVWASLVGWVLCQLVGAFAQAKGFGVASALGHLGGVMAGFLFWLGWRSRERVEYVST